LGLLRYDGQKLSRWTTADGLPSDAAWSLLPSPTGELWAGTEGGLAHFNGTSFFGVPGAEAVGYTGVPALAADSEGGAWIATWGNGVFRWEGKTVRHLTSADGLASDQIGPMHRDPDGTMWFGSPMGLSRYNGKTIVHFATEDSFPKDTIIDNITR